jgi:hypothetical protein
MNLMLALSDGASIFWTTVTIAATIIVLGVFSFTRHPDD